MRNMRRGRAITVSRVAGALVVFASSSFAQTILPSISELAAGETGGVAKFSPDANSRFAWLTANPNECTKPANGNASSWHISLGTNYVVHGILITPFNLPEAGQKIEIRSGEQNPLLTSPGNNDVCAEMTLTNEQTGSRHPCARPILSRYLSLISQDGSPLDICAVSIIVENPLAPQAPESGSPEPQPVALGSDAPTVAIALAPAAILLPGGADSIPSNEMPIRGAHHGVNGAAPEDGSIYIESATLNAAGPAGATAGSAPAPAPRTSMNVLVQATRAQPRPAAAATKGPAAPAPAPLLALEPAAETVPTHVIGGHADAPAGALASAPAGAAAVAPSTQAVIVVPAWAPTPAVVSVATLAAAPVVLAAPAPAPTATESPVAPAPPTAAAPLAAAAPAVAAEAAATPAAGAAAPQAQPAAALAGAGGPASEPAAILIASEGEEPPLISTDFFPTVTTAAESEDVPLYPPKPKAGAADAQTSTEASGHAGLTQSQKIGIGVGTGAGVAAVGAVAGLFAFSRKGTAFKSQV